MEHEGFRSFILDQQADQTKKGPEIIDNIREYIMGLNAPEMARFSYIYSTAVQMAYDLEYVPEDELEEVILEAMNDHFVYEGVILPRDNEFIISYATLTKNEQEDYALAVKMLELLRDNKGKPFFRHRYVPEEIKSGQQYVIFEKVSEHPVIPSTKQLRFTLQRENENDFFGKVVQMDILVSKPTIRRDNLN